MRIRTVALLAASAGLCLAMTTMPAIDDQPGAEPAPPQTRAMPTFNVDFAGGTVGEYLDELASITPINIVAPGDVRALRMPAVRLQSVTGNAAVQLVRNMYNYSMEGGVNVGVVEDGSTAPIYVMSLVQRRLADPDAAPPSVNEIFSVGDVLRPTSDEPTDLQVKKIFEMIDSAMTLAPADAQPDLAFHADTQMLVFRGSPEQRRLIESVLERYNVSWRTQVDQAQRLQDELAVIQLEAQTSAIEAEAAQMRVEHFLNELNAMREMHAQGMANSANVREAEERVNSATSMAQVARARAEHARAQAEALAKRTPDAARSGEASVVIYDFRDLGERGDRAVQSFKALLDAAGLSRAQLSVDTPGIATVTARPWVHGFFHEMLSEMRAGERMGSPSGGGR